MAGTLLAGKEELLVTLVVDLPSFLEDEDNLSAAGAMAGFFFRISLGRTSLPAAPGIGMGSEDRVRLTDTSLVLVEHGSTCIALDVLVVASGRFTVGGSSSAMETKIASCQ